MALLSPPAQRALRGALFQMPEAVIYARDVGAVEDAVRRHLSGATVVGFDIEWRPNFVKGQDNDTAVVQIATDTACLVAHVAHMKEPGTGYRPYLPPALQQLLENPRVLKCGISIANDLDKLAADLCVPSWPPESAVGFVDLAVVAKAHGFEGAGLKTLVKLFGHDLKKSKSVSMSNWEQASLQSGQIFYAAQDAFAAVWLVTQMHRACVQGSFSPVVSPSAAEWLRPFVNLRSWSALVAAAPGLPGLSQSTHNIIREWVQGEEEKKAKRNAKRDAKGRPELCRYWEAGTCSRGDLCPFSHGIRLGGLSFTLSRQGGGGGGADSAVLPPQNEGVNATIGNVVPRMGPSFGTSSSRATDDDSSSADRLSAQQGRKASQQRATKKAKGRTGVCWQWEAGTCSRGDSCKFSHGGLSHGQSRQGGGGQGGGDDSTGLPPHNNEGGIIDDSDPPRLGPGFELACRETAGDGNDSSSPGGIRQSPSQGLCWGWAKQGHCRFGTSCRFAHA